MTKNDSVPLHTTAEKRLKDASYLEGHSMYYFKEKAAHGWYRIGDDHEPFLRRGMFQ